MKTSTWNIALFSLIFIFSSNFTFAKSYKYKSSNPKCSITFPAEYTGETALNDDGKTVNLIVTEGNQSYLFTYTVHNTEMSNWEEMAQLSLETFATGVDGTINKQEKWDFNGHIGRKADITMDADGTQMHYRAVLIGQVQYQMVSFAAKGYYDNAAASTFFNSFKAKPAKS